tara:strand:- start:359 stop:640 length:282 start_codon:yes stop_codon:yes gene_type:complete
MAYFTHTIDPVGRFVEKSVGNTFEWSVNDNPFGLPETWGSYRHKVWVNDPIGQGFRYANVYKTCAYVVVGEDESGKTIEERWDIKNRHEYLRM